jgi:hypothetical protein
MSGIPTEDYRGFPQFPQASSGIEFPLVPFTATKVLLNETKKQARPQSSAQSETLNDLKYFPKARSELE